MRRTGGSPAALAAAVAVSLLAVSGAGGADAQTPKRGGAVVPPRRDGAGLPQPPRCKTAGSRPESSARSWRERSKSVPTSLPAEPRLAGQGHDEEAFHAHVPHPSRGALERRHPGHRARLRLHLADVFEARARRLSARDPECSSARREDGESRISAPASRAGATSSESSCPGTPSPARTSRTIWRDGIDNPKTGDPIGSGPFLVGSFDRGRQFTLVRNPRYWGRAPAYLDRLVFRFIAEPFLESAIEAMRGGTVHALLQASHEPELTTFCRERGVICRTAADTGWEHIAIHTRGPGGHDALEQRSVRQAIAYGIDRNALVRQVYPDLPWLQPLQSFIFVPRQRFYEPHWKVYGYQPAKARRLLEDAGCRPSADGIRICSGERLSLRLFTTPGIPARASTTRVCPGTAAANWRRGADQLCCTQSAFRSDPARGATTTSRSSSGVTSPDPGATPTSGAAEARTTSPATAIGS